MQPAPERRSLLGRAIAVLIVLAAGALVAGYVWSIVNGEAALVTAATAILVFAAGEAFTRRRIAQQHRWDKIAPAYERFVKLLRQLAEGGESKRLQEKSLKVLGDFSDDLLLWGSPAVIEAWTASMRLADTDPQDKEMVLAYARVLLAIRKDLGHSDLTLETRNLLRVTIKDIDQYLPPGARL